MRLFAIIDLISYARCQRVAKSSSLGAENACEWSPSFYGDWGGVGIFDPTGDLGGNYKLAIIYIIVAMFVDGFDGLLARWFDVKTYAKGIDGGLMDNIIDYLNYVVVAVITDDQGAGFVAAEFCDGGGDLYSIDIWFSILADRCQDG